VADNWGFIAVFALLALAIPVFALVTAWVIRPHRAGPIKQTAYECGMKTVGESWVQFRVQYYLYALIFVIFDVETIFLYPWAVAYDRLPMFALFEMFLFLLILTIGLAYAWRKGALEWV